MDFDAEKFKNIAGGIQSLVVAIGLGIGGIWTASTFSILLEAERAKATLESTQASTELQKRELAQDVVINCELVASQIETRDKQLWIQVTVTVSNRGTLPFKLDFSKNLRFYVSHVQSVDDSGIVTYGKQIPLRFDYAEKTIDWMMLKPRADPERSSSIQRVGRPGLYLARFAVQTPDPKLGGGREYSAEAFFVVR